MCTRVRWKAMKIKSFMFAFMPCTKLLKSSNVYVFIMDGGRKQSKKAFTQYGNWGMKKSASTLYQKKTFILMKIVSKSFQKLSRTYSVCQLENYRFFAENYDWKEHILPAISHHFRRLHVINNNYRNYSLYKLGSMLRRRRNKQTHAEIFD